MKKSSLYRDLLTFSTNVSNFRSNEGDNFCLDYHVISGIPATGCRLGVKTFRSKAANLSYVERILLDEWK